LKKIHCECCSSRTHKNGSITYFHQAILPPLRDTQPALLVNGCELTLVRESDGKVLYANAWVTDHDLTPETVPQVVKAGRSRWKTQNEVQFDIVEKLTYPGLPPHVESHLTPFGQKFAEILDQIAALRHQNQNGQQSLNHSSDDLAPFHLLSKFFLTQADKFLV
jgi:hypothetical protein